MYSEYSSWSFNRRGDISASAEKHRERGFAAVLDLGFFHLKQIAEIHSIVYELVGSDARTSWYSLPASYEFRSQSHDYCLVRRFTLAVPALLSPYASALAFRNRMRQKFGQQDRPLSILG
jgi:hypothetical protein